MCLRIWLEVNNPPHQQRSFGPSGRPPVRPSATACRFFFFLGMFILYVTNGKVSISILRFPPNPMDSASDKPRLGILGGCVGDE